MSIAPPTLIWSGTVASGTFRLIDMSEAAAPRFTLEMQQAPDAFGQRGWTAVGLPFSDVLEAALSALLAPHAA